MANVNLPEASVALLTPGSNLMSKPWYQMMAAIAAGQNTLANATGSANTMPGNNTGASAPDVRLTPTQIKALLAIAYTDVSGLSSAAHLGTYASLTGTWSLVDSISGVIEFPDNKDYIIGLNMPFAFTVNSMTTKSSSGTCTLVTKKNTTAVTGLSNSVSTSQVATTATSGNSFVVGDDIRLTVSSNSACEDLSFCLKFTRTLP